MKEPLISHAYQRRVFLTLGVFIAVVLLTPVALLAIGKWLVVADPLEPSEAIVVLGGHLPFRAIEAATIFRKGCAPRVWLTRGTLHEEDVALTRLGIHPIPEYAYSRQVLEQLGVPAASIEVLGQRVEDTAEEVTVISQQLRRVGGKRVILITSKYHTRRVRIIWQKLVGDHPNAVVRYTRDDPFDTTRWWRSSRESLAVAREVLGIVNAWAGFPLRS